MQALSPIAQFDADLLDALCEKGDLTQSDAQALLDANDFTYMQCLAADLSPEATAARLLAS
jgi:hypothetical protein